MTLPFTIPSFFFPTALWVWGANSHGELGDAASVGTNHPIATNFFPAGTTLRRLSAGDGSPLEGSHSLAVDDGRHAFGWGLNSAGQVGNGQAGIDAFIPAQVCGSGQVAPCTQFIDGITAAAAGGFHSLALDVFGSVWGWGFNQRGQIGLSSPLPTSVPARNNALFAQLHQQPGAPVATAIAAGSNHSLALDSRGVLWAWGDNSFGQLGNGTHTFPPGSSPFIATPVTFPETVKIPPLRLGAITRWRWTATGVFGRGGRTSLVNWVRAVSDTVNSPTKLIHFPANIRIVAVAGGATHSLAIDAIGRVWAFGRNLVGQLGNMTTIDSHGPTKVLFPAGTPKAIAIAAGGAHSLAIDAQHNLWAWGLNSNGQLGNPQVGNSTSPVLCQFPQPVRIVTITAGTAHSLALESRAFLFELELAIDITPATAAISAIPHSLSNSPIKVVTKESAIKGKRNRKLMTVRISDANKHKLVMTAAHEKRDGKLLLEMKSLQYNGGKVQSLGPNHLEYEIRLDKAGSVRSLRQHCALRTKAAKLEITASYTARGGRTTIYVQYGKRPRRRYSRPGMTLVRVGTVSGAIGFSDGTELWMI